MQSRNALLVLASLLPAHALADTVLYSASPFSFPSVTSGLIDEFGTTSLPPITETAQTAYAVPGSGPVDLTFRFRQDTGSFLFAFGFYRMTPGLAAIDVSTDAGKAAYAAAALAPGNATLVFDDPTDDPGVVRTLPATGGDTLGFFLIPDGRLSAFQANPGAFPVLGVGSPSLGVPGPFRFPLFSASNVNPGDKDQLLSFAGDSVLTKSPVNLFAWEDGSRATLPGNPGPSDSQFNDLIFTVEGVQAVPEPAPFLALGLGLVAVSRRRRR